MGYYENESAPTNFKSPKPVHIPTAANTLARQYAEEREDLHKLIDTLDVNEVKNVTQYVANLLLTGTPPTGERKPIPRPSCF